MQAVAGASFQSFPMAARTSSSARGQMWVSLSQALFYAACLGAGMLHHSTSVITCTTDQRPPIWVLMTLPLRSVGFMLACVPSAQYLPCTWRGDELCRCHAVQRRASFACRLSGYSRWQSTDAEGKPPVHEGTGNHVELQVLGEGLWERHSGMPKI